MLHLAWILPLALLIAYAASPRYRGEIAQSRVRRILAQALEKNRYTILNDVLLPSGGGTFTIDHVVISRFGIFVIDGVYARGTVSGTAVQGRWKRRYMGRTRRMENPVHRNRVHTESLASGFGIRPAAIHGLVVLDGARGFKGKPPEALVTPEQLVPRIRRYGQQTLAPEQADALLRELVSARLPRASTPWWRRSGLVATLLAAALVAGLYLAYHDDVARYLEQRSLAAEMRADPAAFHPDGRRKTERERWEDSLRCAWSPDTGRCACYEPDGSRAELTQETCRELAERGSVLKQ